MKKILFTTFILVFMMSACAPMDIDKSTNVVLAEQAKQAENQGKYASDTPNMGTGTTTLERTNLKARMERWNDPNKISYIYLLSDNGIIMAFFPIKGKVSSLTSYLTGSQTIVDDPNGSYDAGSLLMESPDYDGSYGDNGLGVFFFLTDGTYIEWNGKYLLADQPVKLSQQPLMTLEVK